MSKNEDVLQQELSKARALNSKLVDRINELEAEERLRKNQNFVQLYKQELKELRALNAKDPTAMSLLLMLVEKMNKQNAIVMSQKTMMKITGKSRPTISRAVKTLRDTNFMQVIKVGSANAYVINSRVFWQTVSNSKFSVFSATVIASEDEQNSGFIEDWDGVELKQVPLFQERVVEAPEEQTEEQRELDLK